MQHGALLNTIRPEFLLSSADYNFYVKNLDLEICSSKYLKLNSSQHQYISTDAWITVFYQIIKTFYLS